MGRQDFSWTVVIFKVLSYFSVEIHVFCTYSFEIQNILNLYILWVKMQFNSMFFVPLIPLSSPQRL